MERITRRRISLVILAFVLLLGFLAFTLYDRQIIETGGKTDNTTTFTTLTRVKAARGEILDRNGNVLVRNRASFDLTINHFVLITANGTNNDLYQLIQRCQEEDIPYVEHFPVSKERPFVYTLSEQDTVWQSYFQEYLAHVGDLDSDITAPLLIQQLREYYGLPETWSDEEARLVIGLWYELDLRRAVNALPLYVFINDADDRAKAEIVELSIPGLTVEASTVREYNTKYAAHILGYTGRMSAKQWEYYKKIDGYEMDAEIGQAGLEEAFEEYLHGVDGWREDTVTTDGTLVSSRYLTEPKAGANVQITIDIHLQEVAENNMASLMASLRTNTGKDGSDAEGCAVVAMDVTTGQVLVCASYPTYDLSRFHEDYELIMQQDYNPLYNRALQATYPPGSTFKVASLIAAIDSDVIKPTDKVQDRGVYTAYAHVNFYAYCLAWTSSRTTHGKINAAESLKVSCNYYYYYIADKMRLSVLDSTAKGLGLGEKTGIELAEQSGYRSNETTKQLLHGEKEKWSQGDMLLTAIGQADNLFTPIQLCSYVATLANRGTRYKATMLNRVVSADYRQLLLESQPIALNHFTISNTAYETYSAGMQAVAHQSGGTAYSVFRNYPIRIAAKTGTAQTGLNTGSDNGAFICYAPADNPRIAIAIYGEKAGGGKTMSTIAKSILDVYFKVGDIGNVNIYENGLS